MNGAESLVQTLLDNGVDTCFTNPGTSEMHFVAALDKFPQMRCVLVLFEGVASGAADAYARMLDKPAATLFHCGPGLANSLANLHNARRARSAIVTLVGDQAHEQRPLDPPLTADTEGLARSFSAWMRTASSASSIGRDAAQAIQAAKTSPGNIATLIMPSDTCWGESGVVGGVLPVPQPQPVCEQTLDDIAAVLRRGEPCLMILGGMALRARGLEVAQRLALKTGLRFMAGQSNARIERGQGRVPVSCVPYPVDDALKAMAGVKHLILAGNTPPVAFFRYPCKPGVLYPEDAAVHVLARPEQDVVGAMELLADRLQCPPFKPEKIEKPQRPSSSVTISPQSLGLALGAMLPENSIVVDESITWRMAYDGMAAAPAHDCLQLTGGAIGEGLPLALGAAVACPDRKVVNLQADGSALYTVQSLWSQARERADVITVMLSNRSYAILKGELHNMGAREGKSSEKMFSLADPGISWVKLAEGLGVEAAAASDMGEFITVFQAAASRKGPFLIELVI